MIGRLRVVGSVVVLALAVAACGDDDGGEASEDVAPTEVAVESQDTGTDDGAAGTAGLEVSGVSFDSGNVFIINDGGSPVDLTGHWICNRPSYTPLPAIELAPGEGIEFAVDSLDPAGGEAAIYASDDFGNSEAIVSYVQWGDGGGRAGVAEDAAIWSGPPVDAVGEGIFLIGEPGSAAGWE